MPIAGPGCDASQRGSFSKRAILIFGVARLVPPKFRSYEILELVQRRWHSPPRQPHEIHKFNMHRLQSLDNLKAFSGERAVQGFVHIVDDDASFRTAIERRLKL